MREYDNSYYDAEDMIYALSRGGEVECEYNGKDYSILPINEGIIVLQQGNEDSEKIYPTPEEAMEYQIDGKRLGDIVPELKIFFRSL